MSAMSKTNVTGKRPRPRRRLTSIRDRSRRVIATTRAIGTEASSVLSSRGQVVIPSEILREALKADQGDRVVFHTIDDQTMIVRIEKHPTSDNLFGVLRSKIPPEMRNRDWDQIRQIAKQHKTEEFQERGQNKWQIPRLKLCGLIQTWSSDIC